MSALVLNEEQPPPPTVLSALNEDAQNGKMKPEFFPPKNPNVNLKRQFEKIFIQEARLKSIVF